jgi:hypothetical protein
MEWLEPWGGVDEKGRAALEDELRIESGLKATALVRRFDRDDVLFTLADGQVVEVHLTWRGSPEPDPRWPRMQHFPSLEAWVEQRMMPDHAEWVAAEGPHKLAPAGAGWFPQAYAVDTNRHLLRLSASADCRERLLEWRKNPSAWPGGFRTLVPADAGMRIEVFAGAARIDAVEFPLEAMFPEFDRLPDGRWVVADARCAPGEMNARILAPDGTLLSRICLGDGIAHLQCDRMGGIWVGYFDEGVYSGTTADPDGKPLGISGINRFRTDGTVSWFPDPPFDSPIDDCYAMTVAQDGVWLYYYSDFPILHVPFDGVLRQWRNDAIRGASLIAAQGNQAVLLGGYQAERDTGALLRLGADGRSVVLRRFRLDPALRDAMSEGFACARGGEIHFVVDDVWTIRSVTDIAAELSRDSPRYPAFVPEPEKPEPPGRSWVLKRKD